VARLPHDARVFARSDFCPVAGFTLGEHFVTFQGHPEFVKPYAEILMESRKALLESAYDKGIASLAETTDEAQVATWMLEFFQQ
jgi:GMP synthase-like glutamine amidotransferase